MKNIKDAVRPEPWVEAERYYDSLEEPPKHYHIYFSIVVEAESEEEAIEKAEEIFEDVPVEEFDFFDNINKIVCDVD